jgi:hypothetical protein
VVSSFINFLPSHVKGNLTALDWNYQDNLMRHICSGSGSSSGSSSGCTRIYLHVLYSLISNGSAFGMTRRRAEVVWPVCNEWHGCPTCAIAAMEQR